LSIQDQTKHSQTLRHWLVLGFSIALTTLTLYFVFRGIDRQVFVRLLATQDRRLLGAAAVFILLQIGFACERWRAILAVLTQGRAPPLLSVFAVFYASIFFNCLPLGTVGGDVARVWLARRFELSVGQLVLSVLVDRMVAVVALVLLALVTLPSISNPLAVTAWLASAAILAAGAAGLLLLGTLERLLGRWRHHRLIYLVLRTAEELRFLMQHGGLRSLMWGVLSGICSAMIAYCIARSLDITVGPQAIVAIMSLVTLVVALPISMAGWGVREVSLIAVLGLLGVDRASALLLSVEFGLLGTLSALPGGVIWLTLRTKHKVAVPPQ
jgi:uncharacterized membrane protein YbhN (UPF0104 family)